MPSVPCEKCGSENPPGAIYCANCGSNLKVKIASTPTSQIAQIAGPETPAALTNYAGFWIRFVAALIDGVIVAAISFFALIIDVLLSSRVPYLLLDFTFCALYFWLLTGRTGKTLGKMASGIKVVTTKGTVPGLGTAASREILGKIISLVFFLGYFSIIWDSKKQGWHDKIALTYAVKVKSKQS